MFSCPQNPTFILGAGMSVGQNSRLRDVLYTMADKNLHILALSEVIWPGRGVAQFGSNAIVYSGSTPDDPHHRRRGVAVVLSERAASAWRFVNSVMDPVSERIL